MKYIVVGAGMQGEAIAYDLTRNPHNLVTVVDIDLQKVHALAKKLPIDTYASKASDVFERGDVVISAVPYNFNLYLTKAAIDAGAHFLDLGGNNTIVEQQFQLHDDAIKNNVSIVPDCGIAPGAVSIITQQGINDLGRMPEYVRIRVGGLPQKPQGPLQYMKVFSIHGLVNECIEPTEILQDGKRTLVESMTGIEQVVFPQPFGWLEAAYTSGGSSTLSKTYEGKIKDLDYKTLRYHGHWKLFKDIADLGFFKPGHREGTERTLDDALTYPGKDALLLRVVVGDEREHHEYTLIDLQQEHTAMQRTTGYSIAIIAQMIGNGTITDRGILAQEKSIPPQRFIDEWRKRDINLVHRHLQRKHLQY